MYYNILEQEIHDLLEEPLSSMGYNIVRIKLLEQNGSVLQVMAERKTDFELSVSDCTKISNFISDILDVEDPISGNYNLEVSSPGIDRPLVRKEDFNRYSDNLVKIVTRYPLDGRRRFRGNLEGVNEDNESVSVILNDTKEKVKILFDDIESAKLVLTDELLSKNSKSDISN